MVLPNAFIPISYGVTKEGAKNPLLVPQLLPYMWKSWRNGIFVGALTYIERNDPSQTRMRNLFDGIGTTERLAVWNILLNTYIISLMYPNFAFWKREKNRMSKTAVNRKRGRGIDPANIYLFTFDIRNTRKRRETCSKSIKKHYNN